MPNPFGSVVQHPSAPLASSAVNPTPTPPAGPVEQFEPSDALTGEAREVWTRQAPFAFQARTLTRATAMNFEEYCRQVVRYRYDAKDSRLRDLKRWEQDYMLAPIGRPMPAPVAAPKQDEDDDAFFSRGA